MPENQHTHKYLLAGTIALFALVALIHLNWGGIQQAVGVVQTNNLAAAVQTQSDLVDCVALANSNGYNGYDTGSTISSCGNKECFDGYKNGGSCYAAGYSTQSCQERGYCTTAGSWNTLFQGRTNPACFVSYSQGGTCPTANVKTYFLTKRRGNYNSAKRQCAKKGGELVAIENAAENLAVKNACTRGNNCWIGLKSDLTQTVSSGCVGNVWKWEAGGCATFTNWGTGQPNRVDCVQISKSTGQWNDIKCRRKRFGVCQKVAAAPPVTTPVPAVNCVTLASSKGYNGYNTGSTISACNGQCFDGYQNGGSCYAAGYSTQTCKQRGYCTVVGSWNTYFQGITDPSCFVSYSQGGTC